MGGARRFDRRYLGTDGTPASGNALKPSTHTVDCAASTVVLPVGAARPAGT